MMNDHEETAPAPRAILEDLTSAIYESNERAIQANLERRDAELARIAEYTELTALIEQCRAEVQGLQSGQGNIAATFNEMRHSTETVERYVRVEASRTKADMKAQEERWLELTIQLGQQVALLDKSNKMLVRQLQMMLGGSDDDDT